MKKTEKKESVSLDDLAEMVANGFREQAGQFDHVNTRIDGVEQKLGALHGEVLSMNYDHKTLRARLESVELRVFGSIQEA